MNTTNTKPTAGRIILGALIGILTLSGLTACLASLPDDTNEPATVVTEQADSKPAKKAAPKPEVSVEQQQARTAAADYLDLMGFSKSGLIEQLEYEGYPTGVAAEAVEHINADWSAEAAESAADYLDTMPFSRAGLIEQLEYEGFTTKQAEHGATSAGL